MQVETANTSRTWTFFNNAWHEGNVAIMGPRTQGSWLASVVFDGARAFEGVTPDLDLHCERINKSAVAFGLKAAVPQQRWTELVHEGLKKFDKNAALYIRPMYWADAGIGGGVKFDPDSTRWCLCLYEAPMPEFKGGSAITLSPYRKPTADTAPVFAKAACLYPNNSMALTEASARGFDNCLLRDMLGNIAELANANVFMVKDGVAYTPVANGTFLSGITRARVIALLRADGVTVVEKALTHADFMESDEIFSAGNFSKVAPFTRIETRNMQIGPVATRARKLYWDFAHA
ncbi:MAG TPA: branched-chain amino acid aminotransferase [Rhizomicrobium sp.]